MSDNNPDKLKKMKAFRFMSECIVCKNMGKPNEPVCSCMLAMKDSDEISCDSYEAKTFHGVRYVKRCD